MPITYIPYGKTDLERINEILVDFLKNIALMQHLKSSQQQIEQQRLLGEQKRYAEPYKAIQEAGGPEAALQQRIVTPEQITAIEKAYGIKLTQPVPETIQAPTAFGETMPLPTSTYRVPGGLVSPETGQLIPTWTPEAPQEGLFARAIRSITGAPAPVPPAEIMPRAATPAERARIAENQITEVKANVLAMLPADKIEQVVYSQLGLTMSPAKREELETKESLELRKATVKEMLQEQKKFLAAQGQAASVLRGGFITDPQTGVQRPLTNIEVAEHLQRIYDKDDPIETATGKLEQFAKKPTLPGVHFPTPTELELKESIALVPRILGKNVKDLSTEDHEIFSRLAKLDLVKIDENGTVVHGKQAPPPQMKFQVVPSLTTPGGHDIYLEGQRGKMPQRVGTAPPTPSAAERETKHQVKQEVVSALNKKIELLNKKYNIGLYGGQPPKEYIQEYDDAVIRFNDMYRERFGENMPLYVSELPKLKQKALPGIISTIKAELKRNPKATPTEIIKALQAAPPEIPYVGVFKDFTPGEIASMMTEAVREIENEQRIVPEGRPLPQVGDIWEGLKGIYKKYLIPKPRKKKDESYSFYPY